LYILLYAVEESDFSNFDVFLEGPIIIECLKYQGNLKLALTVIN